MKPAYSLQILHLLSLFFWGQTPWHPGSLCPPERRPGPDSAESPQEVCGPGNAAHAGPWLSRAGDAALREGVGLPWRADRLARQQLGSELSWALPFLRRETLQKLILHIYQCIILSYFKGWEEKGNKLVLLCVCHAGGRGAGLFHICPSVGHANRWEDG